MEIGAARASAICAVALLFTGCVSSEQLAQSQAKFYAVTAEKTGFFRFGPHQGNGADMELPRDTLMTVIRPSFGYCKVHLTSGEDGYVASDDIGAASPAVVAAASAPPPPEPPPSPDVTPRSEEYFDLNSDDPRLTAPVEELPENGPEPTPIPDTSP